jgi:hypothetical protein
MDANIVLTFQQIVAAQIARRKANQELCYDGVVRRKYEKRREDQALERYHPVMHMADFHYRFESARSRRQEVVGRLWKPRSPSFIVSLHVCHCRSLKFVTFL